MDAPRQDILETCVERAQPVYRERVVWHWLFSQWGMKGNYQYKSFAFSKAGKFEGAHSGTEVGWDTDLFIFLHLQSLSDEVRQSGTDTGI